VLLAISKDAQAGTDIVRKTGLSLGRWSYLPECLELISQIP
jgi:hypothetical protein